MAGSPTTFTATEIVKSAWALYRKDSFVLTAVPFLGNLLVWMAGFALASAGVRTNVLDLLFGPVILGLTVLLARDVLEGRGRPLAENIALVQANFGPLVLLSLASALMVAIGLVLLIVPGLYIGAVLLAHVPFILFDGARWSALRQSYEASLPHAWTLVRLMLMLTVAVLVAIFGLGIVIALLLMILPFLSGATILLEGLGMFASSVLIGVYSCALLYVYLNVTGKQTPDVSRVFE